MPWIEGQKANIIDTESKLVKQANDASMPLKAGISGTTFRMMELADILGMEGEDGPGGGPEDIAGRASSMASASRTRTWPPSPAGR